MTLRHKFAAIALLTASFVGSYAFAGALPAKPSKHTSAKKEQKPSVEDQIQALRQELQSQIDALKSDLANKDAALKQAQQKAAEAQDAAAKAQSAADQQQQAAAENTTAVKTLSSSVDDMKQANASIVATIQDDQTNAVKKSELSDLAFGKVKIGALFYGDWAYYNDTGFGPQFLTQLNQDGPGNGGFNSFDITRTYLNVLYEPTKDITFRLTPNIYRMVNGSSSATGNGSGSQIGGSTNGNLGFRLKYAYVQFNSLFNKSKSMKKNYVRLGQTMNPLVDWEEGLYGYRWVNLTPWNYLSLSSTYVGGVVGGPIEHKGKEYLDYQLGVFNTASFHAVETNDKKQAMGRVTWYPMGTKTDRTGLGVTIFENYGYNTKTPDTKSTPLNRLAILGHYQSPKKGYEIAGEYDLGRNAISTGQLFSGAGPSSTGTYAAFSSLASALVAGDKTRQQGFAAFGHAQLGKSPFKLFGMYHSFQPNTKISGANPLDFRRTVGGISYEYNKYFTFALDDQNLTYSHSQFTMSAAQIATFSSSLAEQYPNGIANAVPDSTNAIFMNVQFSY
ncbi:MAG TPA: hypothetical protein VMV57_06885 [Terracidiphilus sp.]|nr:hypothetical protein [Terracidiphilus sp.]